MRQKCSLNATTIDNAWEITVTIDKPIAEYALDFLHIFNNARIANNIYKVKNYTNSNDVSVWCSNSMKDAVIDYLEQFGEVSEPQRGVIYKVEEPWVDAWDNDDTADMWYDEYPAGQELYVDWL